LAVERTLIILKPDAVVRGHMAEIIKRFEQKSYRFVGMKMIQFTREVAEKHYAEHVGKSFFDSLVSYISMCPVVVAVVEGEEAISVTRKMAGATHPLKSEPGTIRGDLGFVKNDNMYNAIHASDSPESAEREIGIYFSPDEIYTYDDSKRL